MTSRIFSLFFAVTLSSTSAPASPVGQFAHSGDIGGPALAGSTSYDEDTQTYHMSGAGKNLWFGEDEFQFAWNEMEGDFIVRTRAEFIGEGVDPHRKFGWMIRADLDKDSVYADGCVHGDGLTSLQFRRIKGGDTDEVILENKLDGTYPDVIQVERRGTKLIFSAARFGEPLESVELTDLQLPDRVHVGLFLCSHNPEVIEQATFRNVRITRPAPLDFEPYSDYIGSRLEILDVKTGHREVVAASEEPFEAPNWTVDGEKLIVNVSGGGANHGRLRTFDLTTKTWVELETGPAIRNNNDHVISFDGRQLAISNHDTDDWISTIYTLPITGSAHPTRITDPAWGHSFLHGWSPDHEWLVYTAQRDDRWNIYKVNIASREEVQLTDTNALDDGSEYTPDGEWIYFNSARTGTMEIWRMRPDGEDQQQVTNDALNNWFPHVSPDGEWIAFISYGAEVAAEDHPYYQHVTLRLMPIDSSAEPRVVAYVYGGQGTINVPSWAPDSRHLAFVSNSAMVSGVPAGSGP